LLFWGQGCSFVDKVAVLVTRLLFWEKAALLEAKLLFWGQGFYFNEYKTDVL